MEIGDGKLGEILAFLAFGVLLDTVWHCLRYTRCFFFVAVFAVLCYVLGVYYGRDRQGHWLVATFDSMIRAAS